MFIYVSRLSSLCLLCIPSLEVLHLHLFPSKICVRMLDPTMDAEKLTQIMSDQNKQIQENQLQLKQIKITSSMLGCLKHFGEGYNLCID